VLTGLILNIDAQGVRGVDALPIAISWKWKGLIKCNNIFDK
jgi:hypothetical protein